MEVRLYVGNLSYNTTEDGLRGLFSQAGSVAAVDLIKDRMTNTSKGFAFVQMSNPGEAEKAVALFDSYSLDNRRIRVSAARPREDTPRGGFGQSRPKSGDDRWQPCRY